jgi:hypothetical protein
MVGSFFLVQYPSSLSVLKADNSYLKTILDKSG